VLLAIGADAIRGDERHQEVIVEIATVCRHVPAGTNELARVWVGQLAMDIAIGADIVVSREHLVHVVAELFG
jgi:hypothetical protein